MDSPAAAQELERCQMEGVKRPNGNRIGLQGAREHRRRQLQQRDPRDKAPSRFSVRISEVARVQPGPDLIFQQPTCHQGLMPKRGRRATILGQEVSDRYRSVDIDQRSLLSSCSSASSSCNRATGRDVCGGPEVDKTGGVNQPLRTASASTASARAGLLVSRGGPSSATIRSRSVTRTVSPDAATRTYSLSLFFRAFMPTALMNGRWLPVATLSTGEDRETRSK